MRARGSAQRSPPAQAQQCDFVCDCFTPCDTSCDFLELDGVDCLWFGTCADLCNTSTCETDCTSTTACDASCWLDGAQTTCGESPFTCTEKNTDRTLLFQFKVLTLNTWLLPGFCHPFGCIGNAPDRLGRGLVTGIDLAWTYDYDIVLLQEGFDGYPIYGLLCAAGASGVCDEWCNDYWFDLFFTGLCDIPGIGDLDFYPWHYELLPPQAGLELNGGLAVLSKYPISYERHDTWDDCSGTTGSGSDCLAQKGYTHVRVQHPSMNAPIEFVGLHLDADASDYFTRIFQLKQLRAEIDRYPSGVWVVGGDFNIVGTPCSGEACFDVWEYGVIDSLLGRHFRDAWQEHTGGSLTEFGFTADSVNNTRRSGTRQERIDYVWYSDAWNCYELELVEAHVNEFLCQAPNGCEGNHLSDHYGVGATFNVWKKKGIACKDPDPDGGTTSSPPANFDTNACVGVDSMVEELGLSAARCDDYCAHIGQSCSESCTTNRGYTNWGVEAWYTTDQCETYTTSGGQARCDTDLAIYSGHDRRKYRCCCS